MENMKNVAIQAAKEAGKILLENLGDIGKIMVKERGELVTNVDKQAERKIIEVIKKNYPNHTILAEESGKLKGDADYKWIIDPLDGTHNYIRGLGMFGISIAVEHNGKIILGVIYIPLEKELYVACKGEGAYLNGKRIHVSKNKLNKASIIYDSDIRPKEKESIELKNLGKLAKHTFCVRMFGSSARALSFVAEGKIDLTIDYHDKPWDFAAGAFIVEEAGGRVTDIYGKPWSPWVKGYIASNGVVHEEVVKLMQS